MADQLHLDFETRSEIDLSVRGLDNYLRHPTAQSLMLAWAFNEQKVQLWEPHTGQPMPAEVEEGLRDPWVVKFAWNAGFERTVLKYLHNIWVPYNEWVDPMVNARHLSLPGYLEDAGKILKLAQDEAKMEEGARLVKKFTEPAVAASSGGLFGYLPAAFKDWNTDPVDWALFGDYCKNDVIAERAIAKKLSKYPLPSAEQKLWELDQAINDRGMPIDMAVLRGARHVVDIEMTKLKARLKELTGLENPNSNDQMLGWIQEQGYSFGALGKPLVARAFAGECDLTPLGREVLEIRSLTAKAAVHKFTALADNVSEDGRVRGQFVFSGAGRSARWSGRAFQPQNLSRPTKEVEKKLNRALELLAASDYDTITEEFSSPLDVVASCTRSTIKAPEGSRLVVADLSAIENRVLGFISGCEKINQVFREGRDPYLSFAVYLYGQSYDELYHEYKVLGIKDKRNIAKPGTLGCGYQLSGGEEVETEEGDIVKSGLWGYGAAMGVEMTQEDAHRSVSVFRTEFKEVVELWSLTERAAIKAIRTHEDQVLGPVVFRCKGKGMLQIILPSGRPINYVNPTLEDAEMTSAKGKKYTKTTITYEGVGQKTRQWGPNNMYGGRIVENICQAIARDVLAEGMMLATERGFEIVLHVHDEIGAVTPYSSPLKVHDLEECMGTSPDWAPDLLLGAEGFEDVVYRKG